MDIGERSNDFVETIRAGLDQRQAKMWTAMPGIIQSFNAKAMTCEVKPTIQARVAKLVAKNPTKVQTSYQSIPLLVDCPVVFPSGGGCALTFPLKQGDECLVVFASRGIDFWWQQGGVQPPAECRMHDLSDGFVIPGPFSQPRVLSNVSTTGAELRSTDGSVSILLDPGGTITMKAQNVKVDGNLTVTGDVIGESTSGKATNVSLSTHVHTGVQSGPNETGPPA